MTAATAPTTTLPADATALLERGRIPFGDACRFLGMTRQAGNPKARRYVARVMALEKSGRPFDVAKLRPQRNALGEYIEIPAYKAQRGFYCRADLIVAMVYPQFGWDLGGYR